MGEVCCTIERIDHPFITGWTLLGQPAFLGKDSMGREGGVDDVNDLLLCLVVRVGDKVDGLL
jgi:hypothetical protein